MRTGTSRIIPTSSLRKSVYNFCSKPLLLVKSFVLRHHFPIHQGATSIRQLALARLFSPGNINLAARLAQCDCLWINITIKFAYWHFTMQPMLWVIMDRGENCHKNLCSNAEERLMTPVCLSRA